MTNPPDSQLRQTLPRHQDSKPRRPHTMRLLALAATIAFSTCRAAMADGGPATLARVELAGVTNVSDKLCAFFSKDNPSVGMIVGFGTAALCFNPGLLCVDMSKPVGVFAVAAAPGKRNGPALDLFAAAGSSVNAKIPERIDFFNNILNAKPLDGRIALAMSAESLAAIKEIPKTELGYGEDISVSVDFGTLAEIAPRFWDDWDKGRLLPAWSTGKPTPKTAAATPPDGDPDNAVRSLSESAMRGVSTQLDFLSVKISVDSDKIRMRNLLRATRGHSLSAFMVSQAPLGHAAEALVSDSGPSFSVHGVLNMAKARGELLGFSSELRAFSDDWDQPTADSARAAAARVDDAWTGEFNLSILGPFSKPATILRLWGKPGAGLHPACVGLGQIVFGDDGASPGGAKPRRWEFGSGHRLFLKELPDGVLLLAGDLESDEGFALLDSIAYRKVPGAQELASDASWVFAGSGDGGAAFGAMRFRAGAGNVGEAELSVKAAPWIFKELLPPPNAPGGKNTQ